MLDTVRSKSSGATAKAAMFLLAATALVLATAWATADGTPRRLYRDTHVGVAPSDLVVLSSSGIGANLKFYRVQPDGTIATTEYAVPSGWRLVVTDVDWAASPTGVNPQPSDKYALRVFVENRANTTVRNVVCVRLDMYNYGAGYGNGVGGGSALVTGFSVSSAGRLTADVLAGHSLTAAFGTTTMTNQFVVLRGYVVPDA